MPEISIVMPVYNEIDLLRPSLERLLAMPADKEIIVVDDGSSDGSGQLLTQMQAEYKFVLIRLQHNQGKGAALLEGFKRASGNFVTVFDADSEYNPDDIVRMLAEAKRLENSNAAIYGSRFLTEHQSNLHWLVNRLLTGLTNLLFGTRLTDMETCLKLIPNNVLSKLELYPSRFEIEPAITAQLAKKGYAIAEIPISYQRRSYCEGKKIRFRDGIKAIVALIKERLKP
jgi:glycosyltransferase involved in cell wall biosynthesis